jgi:hypothetical protein
VKPDGADHAAPARLVRGLIAAALVTACFIPQALPARASGPGQAPLSFPIAWYDQLYAPASFDGMRSEGVSDVLPYAGGGTVLASYLDAAAAAGSGVFVQIDPAAVKAGDVQAVTAQIDTYRSYPAVRGWYLADEPTIFDSMTPATGVAMYDAIKTEDPVHPVAIAFNVSEDAAPYAGAMDVVLWDFYPEMAGSAEFSHLDLWHTHLVSAAGRWRTDHRFVPIIQAFGPTNGRYTQFRLPTAAEERYMVYAALQTGVDGLFFWSHYAADPTWRSTVFAPLMSEVHPVLPAVEAGRVGSVRPSSPQVTATLFRDPGTKRFVLIAVNNGGTQVSTTIVLPRRLLRTGRRLAVKLAGFGARVARF